jgi:hypothetical protein
MTAVYVYEEGTTLAGRVVAWDPKIKSEEELAEEKGDDIYHYAASEEEAIAQAREVLATPQTRPSHKHDVAQCVLDHLGAVEHEAPCCECGDTVTWDDEAERAGAGPWDDGNAIWCQACWECVGMNQPEKGAK